MSERVYRRWGVGLFGTLALVGFGLLFSNATLLTAAVIPLSYVLYGSLSRIPQADSLTATRELTPPFPGPGESVEVTLTVTNTGGHNLPDVRIIDGVPEALAVSAGSPRRGTPLTPGESVQVSYSVIPTRGEFTFDAPLIRVRTLSAAGMQTVEAPIEGDETITCTHALGDAPFDGATVARAGTVPTDSGGSGLEFFATRSYRRGDPMTRIDWNHLAKTGDFVTIQYQQEHAARVVVVVDARPVGRVTAAPGYPTGATLCSYAGERIYDALDEEGVITSVCAAGVDDDHHGGIPGHDGLIWIDPDLESTRGIRPDVVFRAVDRVADTGATPTALGNHDGSPLGCADGGRPMPNAGEAVIAPDGSVRHDTDSRRGTGEQEAVETAVKGKETVETEEKEEKTEEEKAQERIEHLVGRLPPDAQVILCSPLLDTWPITLGRHLRDGGYPFLVVSPDVLVGKTTGQRIAQVHRQRRILALERLGETVEWDPNRPVEYAIRHALPQLFTNA